MCKENFENEKKEARIKELLDEISQNKKYAGEIFFAPRIYFTVSDGEIAEIPSDVNIITGPSEEENEFIEMLMQNIGFDEGFFLDMIDTCGEFDDECAEEYFEELDEEADEDEPSQLEIYRKIKECVEDEGSPFESIDDFVSALDMFGITEGDLWYFFEGEYFHLGENINLYGECRGYYDAMSPDEWISVLENIDEHIIDLEYIRS